MLHIAPAILKRRGGFSGTSKRPPLRALYRQKTSQEHRVGLDQQKEHTYTHVHAAVLVHDEIL